MISGTILPSIVKKFKIGRSFPSIPSLVRTGKNQDPRRKIIHQTKRWKVIQLSVYVYHITYRVIKTFFIRPNFDFLRHRIQTLTANIYDPETSCDNYTHDKPALVIVIVSNAFRIQQLTSWGSNIQRQSGIWRTLTNVFGEPISTFNKSNSI